jgi:hypothetical protein
VTAFNITPCRDSNSRSPALEADATVTARGVFLGNKCYDNFLHQLAVFSVKTANFVAKFLAKLKNVTLSQRVYVCRRKTKTKVLIGGGHIINCSLSKSRFSSSKRRRL